MFGLKTDWPLEVPHRYFTLEDYEGGVARWCPGCGDLAVLSAVQRICRDDQIEPERMVCVSGIGCSSRFPHYMKTYGFHGLHGRALPVACGIKSRRPDLDVWVATGDGDCCSIGAGHWVHAVRYNMNIVLMLFDNSVYGLTKNQSSPTSPIGFRTNTMPRGTFLPPLNPLCVTLGIENVSFVAQTVDWHPAHLYATLLAAHRHTGFSFVRILQRCPTYSNDVFEELARDPDRLVLLTHENGITIDPGMARRFVNQDEHDPANIEGGRHHAARPDLVPIGLFYRDSERFRYDEMSCVGRELSAQEKLEAVNLELDRFLI